MPATFQARFGHNLLSSTHIAAMNGALHNVPGGAEGGLLVKVHRQLLELGPQVLKPHLALQHGAGFSFLEEGEVGSMAVFSFVVFFFLSG